MARVEITGDEVQIHLSLAEEIFSLHGAFHIPLRHIAAVSAEPVPIAWFRGLRFGTNAAGLFTAASFLTGDGWVYYDIRTGAHCLTLDLAHEHYKRVVIELDADHDPEVLAQAIEAARAKV